MIWDIQTKERGVPMKTKLAYFVSKNDRSQMLIDYFDFVSDSPLDGGIGPT
jgi:hypothetical protein